MNFMRFLVLGPVLVFALLCRASSSAPQTDRSPHDLALSADGRWAVTANFTANSASLIDLVEGKVVAEVPVGQKPFCVALSPGGTRALVTNWFSNTVSLLSVEPPGMKQLADIPVSAEPRGVAFAPDGKTAFVACGADSEINFLDLETRTVTQRLRVRREPWHLAVSPDGQWLVVGNTGASCVTVVNVAKREVERTVPIYGNNIRQLAVSADSQSAYVTHTGERGFPTTLEDIDRGWVIANRVTRFPLDGKTPKEALSLDPAGRASGDAEGLAVSPNGQWMAIASAGAHEILMFRHPLPWTAYGGPGDHMEQELLRGTGRFRWLILGGRPLSARFTPDSQQLIVANYLLNDLQIVDVETMKLIRTIDLGGPKTPTELRRGEAIFYDASRTFHQWFSCHTCHPDGHTNHGNFDTFNDGAFGNPKKTLSLRGVGSTGSWTWHGHVDSLEEAVAGSLTTTLHGASPTEAEVRALTAFLETLDFPPNPYRAEDGTLSESARRGQALFAQRGCGRCHAGANFTSWGGFNVGTKEAIDRYHGYNPPTLRNVYDRSPYLHDGRAFTLTDLLRKHHTPEKLVGTPPFNEAELADVVEFLKSL